MDITKSGTRKEDLLYEKGDLAKVWMLRKILNPMGPMDAMDFLLDKMKDTKSNDEFFAQMNK
jgi:transcription termination factor Rho